MIDFQDTVVLDDEQQSWQAAPKHTARAWRAFCLALGRDGRPANFWYESDEVRAYCRARTLRYIDGLKYKAFDLANIQVRGDLQGHGVFKRMISAVQAEADKFGVDCLYVENVQTERFCKGLTGMGFDIVPDPGGWALSPSFYQRLKKRLTLPKTPG